MGSGRPETLLLHPWQVASEEHSTYLSLRFWVWKNKETNSYLLRNVSFEWKESTQQRNSKEIPSLGFSLESSLLHTLSWLSNEKHEQLSEFIQEQQTNKWIESQTTRSRYPLLMRLPILPLHAGSLMLQRRAGWTLASSQRSPRGTRGEGKFITVDISFGALGGPHTRALCWIASCQFSKLYWTYSTELFLCPHLEIIFCVFLPLAQDVSASRLMKLHPECSEPTVLTWLPPRTRSFRRTFGESFPAVISLSAVCADVWELADTHFWLCCPPLK